MLGMNRKKGSNGLFSSRSLIIHTLGIGAVVWLGKIWGENSEGYKE